MKLRHLDRELNTTVLLNTGFETDEPVIALPLTTASHLNLTPGERKIYLGPGSMVGEAYLAGKVTVTVEASGVKRSIEAYAVIEPREDEAILSDKAIAELGITIDLKHMKWWLT
ncbi:MAG: hypothetical protein DRJ97_07095 [Thermoprotei archaeon]|nr:MAG: hypothetical protein DRJ97_07095 [Thermoprotei archaeon]